jgi:hypothetical protein
VQRDARLVVLRQQQVIGWRPLAFQGGGVDRIGDDPDDLELANRDAETSALAERRENEPPVSVRIRVRVRRRLATTSARAATWSMVAPPGSRPTRLNPRDRRRSKILE